MSILKVEVGKPVTMTVKAIRGVEGKFGAQLAFDSTTGDTLFLGEETAQRQLDRLNMGRDGAIGETLLFEKVAKKGKTYLNINPARKTTGAAPPARQQSTTNGTTTTAVKRPLTALYTDCLIAARQAVHSVLGKDTPPDVVVSAAACLFIESNKSGTPLRQAESSKPVAPSSKNFEDYPDALETEDALPFD